jgi:hypothetical protein
MADRGRVPDGLFVRHPEVEQDQGLPLVGLLCLLTPTTDPETMARRLVPQLASVDEVPLDGAVVPLWTDEADVWPCDLQARFEAQARLAGAAVVVVARVDAGGTGEEESKGGVAFEGHAQNSTPILNFSICRGKLPRSYCWDTALSRPAIWKA